jgi:hypothetical protein
MNNKTKDETNILITQGEINVTTNSINDEKSKEQKIDEYRFEDWKVSQNTIKYFDTIIADLRKYGFTLITGLMTAEFLLGVTKKEFLEIIPITLTTIILIFALFTLDIYFDSLLRSAVRRAVHIEKKLPVSTCFQISAFAEKAGTNTAGIFLYFIFIMVSTIPLWYVPFTNDLKINLFHFLLIFFPIGSLFVIICWVIREFIDIKFDEQCERNTDALEFEYAGQLKEALIRYQQNVDENYSGDFSYSRLAEIYREKDKIDKEIQVLKSGILNIRKNIDFVRPDKKPKLEFFNSRLEEAEFIEKWKDNKNFTNNIESNINELRKRIREITILIEENRFWKNKIDLIHLKKKQELIGQLNNYLQYNIFYIKELSERIKEKKEYGKLINYVKNRFGQIELKKELEFLNKELRLRLQLNKHLKRDKNKNSNSNGKNCIGISS